MSVEVRAVYFERPGKCEPAMPAKQELIEPKGDKRYEMAQSRRRWHS
jgi:hypothetical protein